MHLKMFSAKCHLFCLGHVLRYSMLSCGSFHHCVRAIESASLVENYGILLPTLWAIVLNINSVAVTLGFS